MINTVIFDMDGTVMNTLDDLTDAVNFVLGEFGMPLRKHNIIKMLIRRTV